MIWPPRGFCGIRVVGDVHGDAEAFRAAIEGARAANLFLLQLGDLTDDGPDSPEALRLMFRLLDEGRGLFLLGNHDHKLRRALLGEKVAIEPESLGRCLEQLAAAPDRAALAARAVAEVEQAPAWLRLGDLLFVHGGFHTHMLHAAPPRDAGARRPAGAVARALFGEPTGRTLPNGKPERSYRWIDRIPRGMRVYLGHDRRSTDGRPLRVVGEQGGEAWFLDTGAGKGGHLSWMDLPLPQAAGGGRGAALPA
ncbi:MAG: metallophosphoesterase [Acetobacteraceae bacterium]|nr:metallophosphoesterase [Acetobacteraceae bacterium]